MKAFLPLVAVIASLSLSACRTEPVAEYTQSTKSSQAAPEEITRRFSYQLDMADFSQKQVYSLSYQGDTYTRVVIELFQPLPPMEESEAGLAAFSQSESMVAANQLDGLSATASLEGTDQLLIRLDLDMTRLDIEQASQLSEFGTLFSEFKATTPAAFIQGLEMIGAVEIK